MCGIYGVISQKNMCFNAQMNAMRKVVQHRGPDGHGISHEHVGETQVYLGHVRLAILDLSDNGFQPMKSSCGRYCLTYNGEIYNYLEIKQELQKKGCVFYTETDTEVVLHALMQWGESAFDKFNGMWALVYLDKDRQELLISRDRFGVKPLYYAQDHSGFYFASEIKSILAGVDRKFRLNYNSVYQFLSHSILDFNTDTFFSGIQKVPAASFLKLQLNVLKLITPADFKFYWKYPETQFSGNISCLDAMEHVNQLVTDAIQLRLRSDVPVGVTLSGGIDSSIIACKMHGIMGQRINTFSAISNNPEYSEERFIDQVNLGIDANVFKYNLSMNPEQLFDDYKKIVWFSEQPLLSFSSLAFYYLMLSAKKQGVKVILSGQGADEILCGYQKYAYFYLHSLLKNRRPLAFARLFYSFLMNQTLFSQFNYHHAKRYLPPQLQRNISYVGSALEGIKAYSLALSGEDIFKRQIRDVQSTSVPSLLHYEDRLSMAASVEVRLPFLDYRVVEYCLQLPTNLKLNQGWSKWVLRKSMQNIVPHEIIWRKDKQGFTVPQEHWFRHDFKERITNMFDSSSLLCEQMELIRGSKLRDAYKRFCSNKDDVSFKQIYNPFALEVWLQHYSGYLDE